MIDPLSAWKVGFHPDRTGIGGVLGLRTAWKPSLQDVSDASGIGMDWPEADLEDEMALSNTNHGIALRDGTRALPSLQN